MSVVKPYSQIVLLILTECQPSTGSTNDGKLCSTLSAILLLQDNMADTWNRMVLILRQVPASLWGCHRTCQWEDTLARKKAHTSENQVFKHIKVMIHVVWCYICLGLKAHFCHMIHVITLDDKRYTGWNLEFFTHDSRVYFGEWDGLSMEIRKIHCTYKIGWTSFFDSSDLNMILLLWLDENQ